MTQTQPDTPRTEPDLRSGNGPPRLRSAELLAGAREVLIEHGEDVYRLKLTGNNKLILTK